ncbi:MAG: 2-succinyl-5-enolpyruvyl-6-hydroxy-3-cyclohexene-1-carboxylic-acid synthase [Deltaproteobacteria bacterium]|nr:2-succinyl-5-enolpyruvyl-6-hydroxy-3-cyclohexene-1-carboxylic-acid synthase [Deltaproteobacteria bacterium]
MNARHASDTGALQAGFVAGIVGALERAGVRHAVLSPGYRNAPLALALRRSPTIRSEVVVDERTAAFVALGAARETSAPVVLCCTSGSAPAHWLPAVVEARRARVPLVLLTADRPYELSRVGAPQAVEQRGLFSAHVVYEDELRVEPELDQDVPRLAEPWAVRLAVALAHAADGPVHLDVPLRKPLFAPAPEDVARHPVRVVPARPRLDPAAVALVRDAAARARRPVIVHGPEVGPRAAAQGDAVTALARALGWPLVSDVLASSRGRGDVGPTDLLLGDAAARRLLAPDYALVVGGAPTSRHVAAWLADSRATVHTVAPSLEWLDPSLRAGALLVGPVADLVAAVGAAPADFAGPLDARWGPLWERVVAEAVAAAEAARADVAAGSWDGGVVARALANWPGASVLLGNSLPVRDADALVAGGGGRRLVGNRGANGIDGTVATAWGAAWATGEPWLVVLGDVSARHDLGSLLALPAWLPLCVVVVDNGGGRIFDALPVRGADEFDDVFLTPSALDLRAVAAAAGLAAARTTDTAGLDAALAGAWEAKRATVVEAVVDPAVCGAVRARVGAAVKDVARGALGVDGGAP